MLLSKAKFSGGLEQVRWDPTDNPELFPAVVKQTTGPDLCLKWAEVGLSCEAQREADRAVALMVFLTL